MTADADLLAATEAGLYCPAGDFHIDPAAPVPRAIITHAHGDHARPGRNLISPHPRASGSCGGGWDRKARIETLPYGECRTVGSVTVSFHPAGHILGSAQVRLEVDGRMCVVSGDYKVDPDPTCTPFEPVKCDTFVTESTFGLPIYRWPSQQSVFDELNAWWARNAAEKRATVVYAYSLGKSQRVLRGLDPSIGPIFAHGAVYQLTEDYRQSGVELPPMEHVGAIEGRRDWAGSLILAPPSARATPWVRRFGDAATAFVSGWMQLRGARRRRTVDRGFALSDHADWDGLLGAIRSTEAQRVLVTHGAIGPMVRWLREQGYDSAPLPTHYEGEQDEAPNIGGDEEPAP